MAAIIAVIAAATATGVWSEARFGARAGVASHSALELALWLVLPPAIFFNLVKPDLQGDDFVGIVGGLVAISILGACSWLISTRVLRLPRASTGALISSVTVANTGYLGYPVVAAILGFDALSEAVIYDFVITGAALIIGSFALGAAYGDRVGASRRERFIAFFARNPLLLAAALALVAPDALAPDVLVDLSRVLIISLLPLGFFSVGVALAESAQPGRSAYRPALDRAIVWTVSLRLVGGPLLLLAITAPFIDLPDAYLLMAAMPCGLSTLIVANAYGLDSRLAAGAIAWSTVIAVVCFSAIAVVT